MATDDEAPGGASSGRRAAVLAALIGVLVAAALLAPVEDWAAALAEPGRWQRPRGVALFVALYVVWNFALPPAPLQMLAGLHYGFDGGLVMIVVSTSLANVVSHGLGRWLGRDWIARRARKREGFGAMLRAVEAMGWKGVALLRLSNLIPSNIANLALGTTRLRLPTILAASLLGSLPGWTLMLALGASGQAALSQEADQGALSRLGSWQWAVYGLGAVAALILMIALARRARRVLQHGGRGLEEGSGSST